MPVARNTKKLQRIAQIILNYYGVPPQLLFMARTPPSPLCIQPQIAQTKIPSEVSMWQKPTKRDIPNGNAWTESLTTPESLTTRSWNETSQREVVNRATSKQRYYNKSVSTCGRDGNATVAFREFFLWGQTFSDNANFLETSTL